MDLSLLRAVTVAAFGFSLLGAVFAISPVFNYGKDEVRGVNLGGWLVLEVRFSIFPSQGVLVTAISPALDHSISIRKYR